MSMASQNGRPKIISGALETEEEKVTSEKCSPVTVQRVAHITEWLVSKETWDFTDDILTQQ